MNKITSGILLLVCAIILALSVGCSNQSNQSSQPDQPKTADTQNSEPPKPITLAFHTNQGSYGSEELFQSDFGNFIREKFPHITIQHTHTGEGSTLQEMVAAGTIPDIIFETSANTLTTIMTNGLQYDLAELMTKYQFDLSRFDQSLVDQIKNTGDGKVYGIPLQSTEMVSFYNKELFDRYGVPYLTDGLTWDDYLDLSNKLAHIISEDVIDYGFVVNPGIVFRLNQNGVPHLSSTEDKAVLDSEGWKKAFDTLKRFYDNPDNPFNGAVGQFVKGNFAIAVHLSEKIIDWPNEGMNFDWDVASAPTYSGQPRMGFAPSGRSLYLSSTSKHKDEAFQVIAYLVSDEVQTQLSRIGRVTPLVNQDVRAAFGLDIPMLEGKNLQAVYYNQHAPALPARDPNLTNVDLLGLPGTFFTEMLKESKDVVTTLREMNEKANQMIQEKKAQQ